MPSLPAHELLAFMLLVGGGYVCSLATGVLVATLGVGVGSGVGVGVGVG